jgi:ComEC/Rec2-related protein
LTGAAVIVWVRVDADPSSDTTSGPIQGPIPGPIPDSAPLPSAVAGYLARLSIDAGEAAVTTPDGIRNVLPGDRLQLAARIYPSPPPVFYGAPDHARQARTKDVVASGYLTQPPRYLGTADGLSYRLARYRQIRADIITDCMSAPQGGIAAALLIGDRRHVDDATYDMFRFSGLAHLLAISGLHMGLLCFGVIGFARGVMAIMPGVAVRLPVHKYAALTGLMAAALYVVLSGASISASRAFLMAVLIILAILSDRLALTLRNVAIAALVLLAVNPSALFTCQLSDVVCCHGSIGDSFRKLCGRPKEWLAAMAMVSRACHRLGDCQSCNLALYRPAFRSCHPMGCCSQPDRHSADWIVDHAGRVDCSGNRTFTCTADDCRYLPVGDASWYWLAGCRCHLVF